MDIKFLLACRWNKFTVPYKPDNNEFLGFFLILMALGNDQVLFFTKYVIVKDTEPLSNSLYALTWFKKEVYCSFIVAYATLKKSKNIQVYLAFSSLFLCVSFIAFSSFFLTCSHTSGSYHIFSANNLGTVENFFLVGTPLMSGIL